jgi:hypothetical protein
LMTVCFADADLMNLVSFVANTRAVDHGTIGVRRYAPSHDYLHYNCTRYLLKRERKREKFLYDQYLLKVVWTRYFFVGSIFLWWVWRLVAFKAMSQVCHHITFSQWVQWNFLIWIETRGMTCGESFLASNLYQKMFLKKSKK